MRAGTKHKPESIDLIKLHCKGRTCTEAQCKNISDGHKVNHPFKGKKLSPEHIEAIKNGMKEWHRKRKLSK